MLLSLLQPSAVAMPAQAAVRWHNLSDPQFLSLSSTGCTPAAPVLVDGVYLIQSITDCAQDDSFYIIGEGLEPGYRLQTNPFAAALCHYVNSTAYLCRTTANAPRSTITITWARLVSDVPGAMNLTFTGVGKLTLTCLTSTCPVNYNCTVAECRPGDVITVSGTGWSRSVDTNSTSFVLSGLPTAVQLPGYVDSDSRLINFTLPSWYSLHYTPLQPYDLTMQLVTGLGNQRQSQSSSLSGSVSFDQPAVSHRVLRVPGAPLKEATAPATARCHRSTHHSR